MTPDELIFNAQNFQGNTYTPDNRSDDQDYMELNKDRGLAQSAIDSEIAAMEAETERRNQEAMSGMTIMPDDMTHNPTGRKSLSTMYNEFTGLSGNKAYRNNNPGNITGMGGKLLYGASTVAKSKTGDAGDRAQLVFDSPEKGWNAMHSLMSSKKYNDAPISKSFSKWQSDQKAWNGMKKSLRKSGIDVDKQTFNSLSPTQKKIFMNQRARHEGFTGNLLNDSFFNKRYNGLAGS